jgi:hypothetical protein
VVLKYISVKQLFQTEEVFQFLASIIALYFLPIHLSWWLRILLFLLPDISMLGYLVNTIVGAFSYNLFHHKGIAVMITILGFHFGSIGLEVAGIILFGHASMDRLFGYGLKYTDSFKHTHLGWLPEERVRQIQ